MMNSLSRGLLIVTTSVLLVHCKGQEADTPTDTSVVGARSAIVATYDLFSGPVMHMRPGAILGTYVTQYLMNTSVFRSALMGIGAQDYLFFDAEASEDESFALLTKFGSALQINIADMLNRSTNRPSAYDDYIQNLTDLMQQSTERHAALEEDLKDIQTDRRDKRRIAAQIQSQLNDALREQDYSTASDLQKQIIDAKAEAARVQSQEDEQRSVIRLFENLLAIADKRLYAMTSNREALIAGIKVIDVPGVKDLGLIEEGRRSGSRSTNSTNIFDTGGL